MKEVAKVTDESKKAFLKEVGPTLYMLGADFHLFSLLKVQLLKSLHHPNILQFIGILHKEGKVLVLITEYADGGTLRKIIKNTERLFPWYLRISIARDIASGMVRSRESGCCMFTLYACKCMRMSLGGSDYMYKRAFLQHNPLWI